MRVERMWKSASTTVPERRRQEQKKNFQSLGLLSIAIFAGPTAYLEPHPKPPDFMER